MFNSRIKNGHYMSKCDVYSSDNRVAIAFGDEFDVINVLENNHVEIILYDKNYLFDLSLLDGAIFPLEN